jgi:hypothetical protein
LTPGQLTCILFEAVPAGRLCIPDWMMGREYRKRLLPALWFFCRHVSPHSGSAHGDHRLLARVA